MNNRQKAIGKKCANFKLHIARCFLAFAGYSLKIGFNTTPSHSENHSTAHPRYTAAPRR